MKISLIISAIEQGLKTPEAIALEYGFNSYKEMTNYLLACGYKWSPEKKTYTKSKQIKVNEKIPTVLSSPNFELSENQSPEHLLSYLPLLEYLSENQEKLSALLSDEKSLDQLPRYFVGGRAYVKSVYMSEKVSKVFELFCKQNNISQKIAFESACIEFLNRYGFKDELSTIIKS